MNRTLFSLAVLALLVAFAPAVSAQDGAYDDVEAGQFDNGRMFTLDEPPLDYFRETYNFTPDQQWFDNARLGALRFATYCSASFVSPDGLILTNHHCARQSVTQVGLEDGVDYNEDGFFARDDDDEKMVEGLFVEQLIEIVDVTDEVNAAAMAASDDAGRQQARQQATGAIQARMTEERGGEDSGFRVQIVTLYSGGQYKAYIYRRYDNIKLVFAPETQMGYFGGDPDNFTYPRYSLDFALFRAVDEDGEPLSTPNYFPWNPDGTNAGDLVFVIGNPGSTTRMNTVAQLEYRRDFTEPMILDALATREAVYGEFVTNNPDAPETPELTDTYFSLGNGRKAYTGRVEGLRDAYNIARRRAAERDFISDLAQDGDLQAEYGDVIDAIQRNRDEARPTGNMFGAFVGFGPGSALTSTTMGRAIIAVQGMGGGDEAMDAVREQAMGLEDQPLSLEEGLIAARLRDFVKYLGEDNEAVRAALMGMTPEAAAAAVVQGSALTTMEGTEALLGGGDVAADPAVQVVMAMMPLFGQMQQENAASGAELGELQTRLALARFGLYGTSTPPDATFTLRISDGVVKGYEYNGTQAPPYTTFYGMVDRYQSFCVAGGWTDDCPWQITERWMDAMDDIDMATPYNFVSTNDIIGGNSGSPMLDRNLNVVGIAFDGNIDGLPGNYIFVDTKNRTVSVDVRAMFEALDEVYDMDRIVDELGGD